MSGWPRPRAPCCAACNDRSHDCAMYVVQLLLSSVVCETRFGRPVLLAGLLGRLREVAWKVRLVILCPPVATRCVVCFLCARARTTTRIVCHYVRLVFRWCTCQSPRSSCLPLLPSLCCVFCVGVRGPVLAAVPVSSCLTLTITCLFALCACAAAPPPAPGTVSSCFLCSVYTTCILPLPHPLVCASPRLCCPASLPARALIRGPFLRVVYLLVGTILD